HPGIRERATRKRQRRGRNDRLVCRQRPAPCRRRLLLDHAERGAPGGRRLDAAAARHRQPPSTLHLPRLGTREAGSISIAKSGGDDTRPIEITPTLAAAMLDDAAAAIQL